MPLIAAPKTVRGAPVHIARPSDRRSLSRSATRALDVLECFGRERRWLKAIEIARMLGLQGSSTNQLLKTMVESAHLLFDARHKAYFPSPRLTGLAALINENFGQGDRLRQLVSELHLQTGLSATLTTPNDLCMQIIHIEMPPAQNTERGLKIGLFGSAIGSAYLASLPNSEISRLARRAGYPDDAMREILDQCFQIRREGFADGSGADPAIWTIARPLPERGLPVPLILAVAGGLVETRARRLELRGIMRELIGRHLPSADVPGR